MAKTSPRVAIIGGGVSGMMLAIELKQRLGLDTVTIYEKNSDIGGTWRDNTYPGAACDVPSHFYSFSREKNTDWTQVFSSSTEIQKYWKQIHASHNLAAKTQLNSCFVSAEWSEKAQGYTVNFERNDGTVFTIECEFLVSAIGALHVPVVKGDDLAGISKFEGKSFHSARWDHSFDLKNKKIAIIGSGCSASQIISVLGPTSPTTQITNFMRTPNWYLPRAQADYSSFKKTLFKYVPFYMMLHRLSIAAALEFNSILFPLKFSKFRHYVEEDSLGYMRASAPAEYHDMLTPHYPLGCKRIIIDPGYLVALHGDNVTLTNSPISEITETGITTKDGKSHDFDLIVTATGFDTSAGGYALNVTGRHGKTLEEQWAGQGGPQAYLGTCMSGFPNFLTLLGPNVATGHSSVIFSSEAQINLIVGLISAAVKDGVTSVEVKVDVEKQYNVEIQRRLEGTVWNGGCLSWYKVGSKLVSTWPGTLTELWWRTRTVGWEAYRLQGTTRSLAGEARKRQRNRIVSIISLLTTVIVLNTYGIGFKSVQKQAFDFILTQYGNVLKAVRV